MSARRAARVRRHAGTGGMPGPLRSRTHPLWADRAGVLAAFGGYLSDAERAAVVAGALRPYQRILCRWARDHGHTGPDGSPDWRALHGVGWGQPHQPAQQEHNGRESRYEHA